MLAGAVVVWVLAAMGTNPGVWAIVASIFVAAIGATWTVSWRMGRTDAKLEDLSELLRQHLREGHWQVPRRR